MPVDADVISYATPAPPAENVAPAWRPMLATGIALLSAGAVMLHLPYVNRGGPHMVYTWQSAAAWRVYPLLALPLIPFAIAQGIRKRWPAGGLLFLGLSLLLFQTVGFRARTDMDPTPQQVIRSRVSTGFYADGLRLRFKYGFTASRLLAEYPEQLPKLFTHSRDKPPGPVLFYHILQNYFDSESDTLPNLAIALIALVTACAAATTCWFAWRMLDDRKAAWLAASALCLAPSLWLFFPFFDTCYATVTALLFGFWTIWLRTGRLRYAIFFAGLLTGMTFWAYNVLVLGAALVAMSAFAMHDALARRRFVRGALLTSGVVAGFYGILYLTTHFNPIATFQTCLHLQHLEDAKLQRQWPWTMPNDFFHFALGMGGGAAAAALLGISKIRLLDRRRAIAVGICAGQIAIVGLTGLLKSETLRVWIFLIPLGMLCAGVEMARWPRGWQYAFWAASWFAAAACCQNLITSRL
jgi:hypothetical protein